MKHSFEKVDDHWEAKDRSGPSDPQSARSGAAARIFRPQASCDGVDALGHSRDELLQRARALHSRGRSKMRKAELAKAIARRQG